MRQLMGFATGPEADDCSPYPAAWRSLAVPRVAGGLFAVLGRCRLP
ncbi:hypothetical protein [Kribbella sp. NPDC051718]